MEQELAIMKLKSIIYITRLSIPKKGPRSVQVLKNCLSLAGKDIEVVLYVKKNRFSDINSISNYYGLQMSHTFHIKTLPSLIRFSPILIAIFVCLQAIFDRNGTSFYVRDLKLAKCIIQLKWLHKIPVFLEVHGISWFNSKYPKITPKNHWRRNKSKLVEFITKNSNGLICAFKETEEFLLASNIKTPAVWTWFGTEPESSFNYDAHSRKGIYYIGSFSKSHSPEMFIEAMKHVRNEKLILIGGYSKEEISYVKDCAKKARVADRVIFKDYVPPAEIRYYLKQAKIAIALWAGLKLTDYFSHGLPVVACNSIGKGILRNNNNCIFFDPKDPRSLADAINKIHGNPVLAETLAKNAYKTAQEFSWQKRAEKIINLIKENI